MPTVQNSDRSRRQDLDLVDRPICGVTLHVAQPLQGLHSAAEGWWKSEMQRDTLSPRAWQEGGVYKRQIRSAVVPYPYTRPKIVCLPSNQGAGACSIRAMTISSPLQHSQQHSGSETQLWLQGGAQTRQDQVFERRCAPASGRIGCRWCWDRHSPMHRRPCIQWVVAYSTPRHKCIGQMLDRYMHLCRSSFKPHHGQDASACVL